MAVAERTGIQLEEDRFDRFRRISWWDQARLRAARVLVAGAGALGNEILKNLALLGVGNLFVADLDSIEPSNLSRSVLFRERDSGRPKAQVAAEAVRDLYPEVQIHWFHGDVIHSLGLGVFDWADLAIAGLDNREARLRINRGCWKTNTPFIDGATEVLQGVVRVFTPPHGPCYECTLSAADWEVLNERRGCAGLRAENRPPGTVPTTPITASIIAALQCQEALKLLHGMETLAGRGLIFDGLINDSYVVRYNASPECNSHESFDEVVRLERSSGELTLGELLELARRRLGGGAAIEFNDDLLLWFECPACGRTEEVFRPLGAVSERAAACPRCGAQRRLESTRSALGSEAFLERTLDRLGVPPFDILGARKGFQCIGFELAGDAPAVLGPLYRPAKGDKA